MDKPILVFYISCDMPRDQYAQLHEQLEEQAKKENMLFYIIPSEESQTRIECINPKLVSTADYEEAKAALDKCTNLLNDLTNSIDKAKEIRKMFSEHRVVTKSESFDERGELGYEESTELS